MSDYQPDSEILAEELAMPRDMVHLSDVRCGLLPVNRCHLWNKAAYLRC